MDQPLSAELAAKDGRLLAGRQLPVGRPDLSLRQSAAERAAAARAHQAAAAGPLGHHAGAELHLRPPEPGHQAVRPQRDLHHRAGPRGAGHRGQHLPGRDLQRTLPERLAGRAGDEAALHAVLLSRRHPQPRGPGDARLDPRRAANWATRSRTPTAPCSTTPICWSPAWSATARRRPARWPPVGTRTSSSIRSTTARCCRSCT